VIFFGLKERRIPLLIIEGTCVVTIGYIIYGYKKMFMNFTDLGFAVTTVHMAGKICMSLLLGYPAYVWDRKKKAAYEMTVCTITKG